MSTVSKTCDQSRAGGRLEPPARILSRPVRPAPVGRPANPCRAAYQRRRHKAVVWDRLNGQPLPGSTGARTRVRRGDQTMQTHASVTIRRPGKTTSGRATTWSNYQRVSEVHAPGQNESRIVWRAQPPQRRLDVIVAISRSRQTLYQPWMIWSTAGAISLHMRDLAHTGVTFARNRRAKLPVGRATCKLLQLEPWDHCWNPPVREAIRIAP